MDCIAVFLYDTVTVKEIRGVVEKHRQESQYVSKI